MMHQRLPISGPVQLVAVDGRLDRTKGAKEPLPALNPALAMALALLLLVGTFLWPRVDISLFSASPAPHSSIAELRGFIDDLPVAAQLPAAETTVQQTAEPNQTVVIPGHPIRTALLLLHIVGLVLGFGSALFLDLYLISRLYHRAIEPHAAELLRFGSHIVLAGLAALWASGLGFLAFYASFAPDALDNPKLAAKIAVVVVLTINGVLLHQAVMPRVHQRIDQPLLRGLPLRAALLPLAAGVISGASWAAALIFGVVKELNYAVPALVLLAGYAAMVLAGIAAASFVHRKLSVPNPLQERLSRLRGAMLQPS